jgi:ribonuclease T1
MSRRFQRWVVMVGALLAMVAMVVTQTGLGGGSGTPQSGSETVKVATLSSQAQHTIALIEAGGPFPYSQDNTVFRNAEGLLPAHQAGYYHEFTVVTPGSPDRGARRIIVGQGNEFYYTGDHYRTFQRIVE